MPDGPTRVAPVARPAVAMLARSPRVAGKTRLTSHLSCAAAETLRQALLLDTVGAALMPGWPLHIFVTPVEDQQTVRGLIAADAALAAAVEQCHVHAQAAGGLGERMSDAMRRTLAAGHDAVVVVGSDLPALPASALADAVAALSRPGGERRLVFGPARDGGFYLIAGCDVRPEAFAGVTWSCDSALAQTEARARAAGLDVTRVEACDDVDVMDDLERVLRTQPLNRAPRTRRWAVSERRTAHE
jgi:uncharacterized protein